MKRLFCLLLAGATLASCQPPEKPTGADTITGGELAKHIATLSSDMFGGRSPSSPGEELTVNYLIQQFKSYGLKPGNGDSWVQEVPLVEITPNTISPLTLEGKGQYTQLAYGKDMIVSTRRVGQGVSLANSPLVFVGYGIVAPEYGWNDYAGVDMRGKTAVILINDPGYATRDPALFNGFAMTYYGRWTYKFEEAARQGAAGAIIIHETGAAAYPWSVVQSSWSGPSFYAEAADGNKSRAAVEGWITTEAAQNMFVQAGLNYQKFLDAAKTRGFKPLPLPLTASVSLATTLRRSVSRNVLALLQGSERSDEVFVYMAHWDHLGTDPTRTDDPIYNGALDNASGTAALLEMAQAFSSLPTPPKRSVLFLAVTAEEQGLLGSQYYADHPVYPLNKTVAGLNTDGLNIIGRTRDLQVIGYGFSDLDAALERAAATQQRVLVPDTNVEKGYYYRSDHFNLAKRGVPMIYPDPGVDSVEHGREWGKTKAQEYTAQHYHQPSDEYSPTWDMSGAEEDVRLYFAVGLEIANGDAWPQWSSKSEFRAVRDAQMTERP